MMDKITTRIAEVIEDSDHTVAEAAEYIGVDRRQIYRWTKQGGSEMGIFKLAKFCEFYGVSAEYILGLPEGIVRPR